MLHYRRNLFALVVDIVNPALHLFMRFDCRLFGRIAGAVESGCAPRPLAR